MYSVHVKVVVSVFKLFKDSTEICETCQGKLCYLPPPILFFLSELYLVDYKKSRGSTFSRLESFTVDVNTGHLQNPLLARGRFQ